MSIEIPVPDKYKISDKEARNWFTSTMCFLVVYTGMMAWGMGLQNYVDDSLQREISTSLTFLLIVTMSFSARDMIPAFAKIVGEMYWQSFVWHKEWDKAWAEEELKRDEERRQKFMEDAKKQQERQRKKKMKAVGEPINLKEWAGSRSYWQGGYIYVLKDVEISGYYKIGKTKKPIERMKAFGVYLPFATELIHVIKCHSADEVERSLHRQYADKRQRGEWFALTDEDVAAIKLVHEVAA